MTSVTGAVPARARRRLLPASTPLALLGTDGQPVHAASLDMAKAGPMVKARLSA